MKQTTLFICQHTKTRKKYLGKTTNASKLGKQYFGSGLHWKNHLARHGKESAEIVWRSEFNDQNHLEEFALFLSEELDVVESREYLNLVPENGLDGGNVGNYVECASRWKSKTEHCEHCDDWLVPQVYARLHGDYCESNPERKVKKKIKCNGCGEEKLPHIYHRDHGPKCGNKRNYREDCRPNTSCIDCRKVVGGLANLNQHQRGKVCKRNQEKMSLSN